MNQSSNQKELNKELKLNKHGKCEKCNQINMGKLWCQTCNSKRFQQNFNNWTSGNDDIDEFIQNTQLSANNNFKVLEWIPYDKFYNVEYISKGRFNTMYKAI